MILRGSMAKPACAADTEQDRSRCRSSRLLLLAVNSILDCWKDTLTSADRGTIGAFKLTGPDSWKARGASR